MKISKGMRHQVLSLFTSEEGYWDITSILWDVQPSDVLPVMEEWLDANCSNGHFSRWTGFGYSLYGDAERYLQILEELSK